jgi:hypothetical protein
MPRKSKTEEKIAFSEDPNLCMRAKLSAREQERMTKRNIVGSVKDVLGFIVLKLFLGCRFRDTSFRQEMSCPLK